MRLPFSADWICRDCGKQQGVDAATQEILDDIIRMRDGRCFACSGEYVMAQVRKDVAAIEAARGMTDTQWDADIQAPIDIVQRLEWPFPHTGPLPDSAVIIMREAALEIVRLRAQWRDPDGVDMDAR